MSNRPPNYLAFLYGKLSSPSGEPIEDGKSLGRQCVDQLRALEDRGHFPPKLLILLASPAYLEQSKAAQLVAGAHRAFADENYHDVPLIGSTLAAVFFDQRVHPEGALLVCLASRLVEAKIAIGVDARNNPETAVNDALKQLDITPGGNTDPNPFADLIMLTFLPGFGDDGMAAGFPAPELHRLLCEGVKSRIWIAGGVSSTNDQNRSKSGLQFADRHVLKDAIVTALIKSGTPIAATFEHGLSHTGEPLQVTKLSKDKRTVHEFNGRPAAEVIREKGEYMMLGEMSAGSGLVIDVPREAADGSSVELMREVRDRAFYEILMPEPAKIQAAVEKELVEARERIPIANPLACLMLPCNAWRLRYKNVGLEIERLLSNTEDRLGVTTVGGFVDGEMGVDRTTRSVFGNGAVAGLIFGDEVRRRSLSHRALGALAENGKEMTGTVDIEEAIRKALEIVVETGFPGAKLWLVQRNRDAKFVVAKDYIGKRFEKTGELVTRPLMAHNILAIAARERKAFFIRNSSQDQRCDQDAVRNSGIVSQYIVPLLRMDGARAIGVLQVDLGDLAYLSKLPKPVIDVLDSFGSIFGATFARILNLTEAEILRLLDMEFNQSLSAGSLEEGMQTFIEKTLAALGLKIGYVRIADHEQRTLKLIAGAGPCYQDVMRYRREALFEDASPLNRAFLEGKITTVNDARRDPLHNQMIVRSEEQYPEIARHLKEIGSFVAVALENEAGHKLGVLGLYSDQPWFFTSPRIRVARSLGNHMVIIIERFEKRRAEEKARRLFQFRSDIFRSKSWYQPVTELNLDSMPELLNKTVSRFRSAIGAETASLYLKDETTQRLILRSQDGWITDRLNIASYRIGEGWTGNLMMSDQVDYVPDMRDRKKKTAQDPLGRYAVEMFGAEIPGTLTVESIGLPLKIGEKRLGVLSLHRRVRIEDVGKRSWVETTDQDLLQEGADALSVYINTLLSQKLELWEKEERTRWEQIWNVFVESLDLDKKTMAEKLCQQTLESLGAAQVNFYEHSREEEGYLHRRIASRSSASHVETDSRIIGDELVSSAGSPPRSVQFRWANDHDRQRIAAQSELVEDKIVRICIPLEAPGSSADADVDVIDIHWERANGANPMLIRDNSRHLKTYGNQIGSVYHRNRLLSEKEAAKKEASLKESAVQAMGLMLAQSGHRVTNLIQALKHLPPLLMEARHDEKLFKERIARMEERLKSGTAMIERPLKIGRSIAQLTPHRCNVSDIIKQAIGSADVQSSSLVVDYRVSSTIFVLADEDQIREALYNLIDNAIKATPAGGVLTIEADAIEVDKTAKILIADTGHGMTRSEIEAAKSGFISTRGHTGLGVLISTLLIRTNNGNIDIESVKGGGTRITITLPLASKEKAHGVESVNSGR
ncbi:MAG: GAF domain-containing protein [Blastocatellia bacterium]|nr:GAF domain-containing protein [Blastocatellia bacterium]